MVISVTAINSPPAQSLDAVLACNVDRVGQYHQDSTIRIISSLRWLSRLGANDIVELFWARKR